MLARLSLVKLTGGGKLTSSVLEEIPEHRTTPKISANDSQCGCPRTAAVPNRQRDSFAAASTNEKSFPLPYPHQLKPRVVEAFRIQLRVRTWQLQSTKHDESLFFQILPENSNRCRQSDQTCSHFFLPMGDGSKLVTSKTVVSEIIPRK